MKKKVLVAGGLGFLGCQLVHSLSLQGYALTVIDGLLENTGANMKNYFHSKDVNYILEPIEDVHNLKTLVENHKIIIDCMGWTSHIDAFVSPLYDLELNVASHWHIINHLNENHKVIFLGARGQYGVSAKEQISEENPLLPIDIQGIHKVAAESYYRVYALRQGFTVLSLRIPNCFGPFQKLEGSDIGLIGSMLKDALADNNIVVYGNHRKRSVLFSIDLAEIIARLITANTPTGFIPLNINGLTLPIIELARIITSACAKGTIQVKEIPEEFKSRDSGNESLTESKIKALIGELNYTPVEEALSQTIKYITHHYDLQM